MRNLLKNQTVIKALNYLGTEAVLDNDGYLTGEKKVKYSPVIVFRGHISGARGVSQVEIFGTDISYDKTIVISKDLFDKLKFNENTVFFIGIKVKFENGTPLYNYRVSRIAETLNEVVIAVKSND